MTKSLVIVKNIENESYWYWSLNLVAPKFTLKNFADELHYYFRLYLRQKKPILQIIVFLFLNAIQRIFYTFGTYLVKIRQK